MKVKDKEKLNNPLKGWQILSSISSVVFHTVHWSFPLPGHQPPGSGPVQGLQGGGAQATEGCVFGRDDGSWSCYVTMWTSMVMMWSVDILEARLQFSMITTLLLPLAARLGSSKLNTNFCCLKWFSPWFPGGAGSLSVQLSFQQFPYIFFLIFQQSHSQKLKLPRSTSLGMIIWQRFWRKIMRESLV